MYKETQRQIDETYHHIKPYLTDLDSTKDLRKMCEICEAYYGEEHDYEECKNRQCFKLWLAYEYLEWSNSN